MPKNTDTGETPSSARRTMNRKTFLGLGVAGLAGVAFFLAVQRNLEQMEASASAPGLDIVPDNPDAAIRNRENLVATLRNSDRNVTFPAGDYYIDNSSAEPGRGSNANGYIVIDDYEGSLKMNSGARFVFTDSERRGFNFNGGAGAHFSGLKSTFTEMPTKRVTSPQPQECILFQDTVGTSVQNVAINGSAAAGLIFVRCLRPSVEGARITNTMADGLHFANCENAIARDIVTENTGDDGLAFVNYANGPDNSGGEATNITVKDGGTRGITVIGQRDIIIDGFEIDGTYNAGIQVAYEESFTTRVPNNVTYRNGTLRRVGRAPQGNGVGQPIPASIACYYTGPAIRFVNIDSEDSLGSGVNCSVGAFERENPDGSNTQQPPGEIYFSSVSVQNTPESGFDCAGGFLTLVGECSARETGKTGMRFEGCERIHYGRLIAENTSRNLDLNRAFWFEGNDVVEPAPDASAHELVVADDQETPTGYRIFAGGRQSGALGAVQDNVVNGEVVIENLSSLRLRPA